MSTERIGSLYYSGNTQLITWNKIYICMRNIALPWSIQLYNCILLIIEILVVPTFYYNTCRIYDFLICTSTVYDTQGDVTFKVLL